MEKVNSKMRVFLIVLFAILTTQSYSQIVFEEGYFVDESNQRTECLIKNIDWYSNPTDFQYKLTQDGSTKIADIHSVKEFGVGDVVRYTRANVEIDYSSNNVNKMDYNKNPEFTEELLFLKVLIDGEASLFIYRSGNLTRFFYKINNSEIKQLIYKQYLVGESYAHNNTFRQQLFVDMKCKMMDERDFSSIDYDQKELERLFVKYNNCQSSDYVVYESREKKNALNFSLRPGLNFSNLSIENSFNRFRSADFENGVNFRLGAELEIILPFNKSKWSLLFEPTYQYYSSEGNSVSSGYYNEINYSYAVDYASIELPVGLRHYFFLNDDFKLFANVSYILDFSLNSSIARDFEISSSASNQALGVGLKFMDKYALEIRYHTKRNILNGYQVWSSDYNTTSVIFGYSLF